MTLDELRSSRRGEILGRANAWGARNVRVFGSLSRGDNKPESDIDFLIDLDPDRTLMDLGGVLTELQQMLQVPVDVTTEKFSGRTFGIARCAMQSRYERRSGTTGRHIQSRQSDSRETQCDQAAFTADEMLQVWVLHHLQVVGETARCLSQDFRLRHPDKVWAEASGLRHILVHHGKR